VSVAAFFDIDGTITKTTILDPLIWYRRAHDSSPRLVLFAAGLLLRVPCYLWVDHRSRGQFNIIFYRHYAGLNARALRDWHRAAFALTLQRRVFPAALACIRDHQRQGHRTILVTGGLEIVNRPLAEFLNADELIATRMREHNGIISGAIDGPPLADAQKAVVVRDYAQRHGIDLELSFAYGNSTGDAPMLECVGHPIVVNADRRLCRLAGARGWTALHWHVHSSGTSCA
jgi:HAD superfamily hydrolase (TIGR01490 family)